MYSLRVNTVRALCALALLTCSTISTAQSFEIKRYDNIYGSDVISRGDFNNDGILDVIVGGGGNGTSVTVFPGNPDGTLRSGISTSVPAQVNDVALGDFNHDGKLDVA